MTMLQRSIAARSAAQPLLLSLAGRLELATAQLPRQAADGSDGAAVRADDQMAAARAVASRLDSHEDEPLAADALADGLGPDSGGSGDEDEEEELSRLTDNDSVSDASNDLEQDDGDREQ